MNKITFRQLAASTLLWLAACVVVALASSAAYAQGTPNKLESVDVQNLAGQQLQITLRHAAPPTEPVAFTIDNPARLSLDLANTALALSTSAPAVWIRSWPRKPRAARAWCSTSTA
jgi:type IV pilus assembly protein PilQ